MSDHRDEILPIELRSIAERLHGSRYEAGPLELDRIKKRAMAQASPRPSNPHKGMFMRSKLLSIALAVGLLLTTASVGLAVTGNFPSAGSSKSSASPAASPRQSASSGQYAGSEQCKTLRTDNRADEKALRASDKKITKKLKGRDRKSFKANSKSRRTAFRLRNRANERRCNRTGQVSFFFRR